MSVPSSSSSSQLLCVAAIISVVLHFTTAACPFVCKCNQDETVVSCTPHANYTTFHLIPPGLPDTIQELTLTRFVYGISGQVRQFNFASFDASLFSDFDVTAIRVLRIQYAQIQNVDRDTFNGFNALRELDLSHNSIRDLDFLPSVTSELTHLTLSRQEHGEEVVINRASFGHLRNLISLALEELHISTFPTPALSVMSNLESLVMSGNPLRVLQLDDFRYNGEDILTNLESLFLKSTYLPAFPANVGSILTRLEVLDLGHNYFGNFTKEYYSGFPNLKQLYLNGNNIPLLPEPAISGNDLPRLEVLNMDGNQLRSIPSGAFQYLATLKTLSVIGNQIEELPNLASSMPNLESLFVSGNRLRTITAASIQSLNQLDRLQLSQNIIEGLDSSLQTAFTNIDTIELNGNDLHCSCDLRWLYDFWVANRTKFGTESLVCSTGADLVYQRYFEAITESDHFECTAPEVVGIEPLVGFRQYGRDEILTCTATGDPTPVIVWTKPNQQTEEFVHESLSDGALAGRLELNSYSAADLGFYLCTATNSAGSASANTTLVDPSRITTPPPPTVPPSIVPSRAGSRSTSDPYISFTDNPHPANTAHVPAPQTISCTLPALLACIMTVLAAFV